MIGKILYFLPRPVKNLLKRLYLRVMSLFSVISGFYLPPEANLTTLLMALGLWEGGTKRTFKRLTKKGGVAVDIGAHVGYYSVFLSKLVGEGGRVFSFEPSPVNFPLLKKNVFKLRNIVANNLAVGDKAGTVSFYQSKKGSGRHSLVSGRCDDVDEYKVEVVSLDQYFSQADLNDIKIDLMKVDVEGFEPEVFRGAQNMIEAGRINKIIFECYPGIYPVDRKPLLQNFVENLRQNGYKLLLIDEKTGDLIEIEEPLSIFLSKIEKTVNLVAVLPEQGLIS